MWKLGFWFWNGWNLFKVHSLRQALFNTVPWLGTAKRQTVQCRRGGTVQVKYEQEYFSMRSYNAPCSVFLMLIPSEQYRWYKITKRQFQPITCNRHFHLNSRQLFMAIYTEQSNYRMCWSQALYLVTLMEIWVLNGSRWSVVHKSKGEDLWTCDLKCLNHKAGLNSWGPLH